MAAESIIVEYHTRAPQTRTQTRQVTMMTARRLARLLLGLAGDHRCHSLCCCDDRLDSFLLFYFVAVAFYRIFFVVVVELVENLRQ